MMLFFGDSLTSGENNHSKSYVSYLNVADRCLNFGVSGTTIGDYSLYPVESNDLLNLLYKNRLFLRTADVVFLEYGINDITSVAVGYARLIDVIVALNKCVDFIKQMNSSCRVVFILPAWDLDVIPLLAQSQFRYIKTYLDSLFYNKNEFEEVWIESYKTFAKFAFRKFGEKNLMTLILNKDFMYYYISEDGIHPTDFGYQIIADCIKRQMEEKEI